MQSRIKTYYTTCFYAGIDGKKLLFERYALASASDASRQQLSETINFISEEGQQWRRRVMAAIGARLKAENRESNANIIKAIACRAAKVKNFNSIQHPQLRRLYNQFSNPATSRELLATS